MIDNYVLQSSLPQLVNSELAAVGRLDAAATWDLKVQATAFYYITSMAEKTGVVSVYGLVSSEQDQAGWDKLSEFAERLETFGGQIETHSHNHAFNTVLTE
jgi:hypothetical protein